MVQQPLELDRGFQARLRAVYLDTDARCPHCDYHLRGVPGPRCPECGVDVSRVLRTADSGVWRLRRERLRWLARRMIGWALFGIVGILVTAIVALTLK